MSKHTPGPWAYTKSVNFGHESFNIHQADGAGYTPYMSDVGTTELGEDMEIQEANARLIAAAPQMLEALDELVDLKDRRHMLAIERYQQARERAWEKCRAAIRAAKGESK